MEHEVTKEHFTNAIIEAFEVTEHQANEIVAIYDTIEKPYTENVFENIALIEEDECTPEMVEDILDNKIEDYIQYNLNNGYVIMILK